MRLLHLALLFLVCCAVPVLAYGGRAFFDTSAFGKIVLDGPSSFGGPLYASHGGDTLTLSSTLGRNQIGNSANNTLQLQGDSDLTRHCMSDTWESPDAGDFWLIRRMIHQETGGAVAMHWAVSGNTAPDFSCIVDPAGTGESITVELQECDDDGDNCTELDTFVCDNDGVVDGGSGTWEDTSLEEMHYFAISVTARTGTITQVSWTMCGYMTGLVRTGPPE